MFPKSRANTHVRELLDAAEISIENRASRGERKQVRIFIADRVVGTGDTVVDAVLAALPASELAQVHAQTLLAAAALSLGPANLLEAFMALWGEDEDEDDEDEDDEDDEDDDEDDEDDEEEEEDEAPVRFRRRG